MEEHAQMPLVVKNSSIFLLEKLDPVDRLLVESIRVDLDKESGLDNLEAACRSFTGWSRLASRAAFQGVIGWTHEALSRLGKSVVPAESLIKLREVRISYAARIASINADLSEMLNALSHAGIKHILLKGPFLAEYVYPRSDLRYYTDIDLLVKKADVNHVHQVLNEIGYTLLDDERRRGFFDQGKTQVHYFRNRCLPLDLHWELVNPPSHLVSLKVDTEEVWNAAVDIEVAGVETLGLSAEDALIFQCLHMTAHHDFNRLLWFKDVEQVIRRYHSTLNWGLLVEKCNRYGIKTFVYYAIMMTAGACGELDVPEWVIAELKPRYLTARLFEHLLRKANILEMQSNRRRPALEVWRIMRDEPSKRLEAVMRRMFPGVEWYLECYPFLPKIAHRRLYYFVYPVLMAIRLIKRPIEYELSDTLKS